MSGLFQFSNDIFIFLERQTSPTFQPEQPSDQNVSHVFNTSDPGPERYWSQWRRVTQDSTPHLAASFQSLLGKTEAACFTRLPEDYFIRREFCCSEDSVMLSRMPVVCDPTLPVAGREGQQQSPPWEKMLCIRYWPTGVSPLKWLPHNSKPSGWIFLFMNGFEVASSSIQNSLEGIIIWYHRWGVRHIPKGVGACPAYAGLFLPRQVGRHTAEEDNSEKHANFVEYVRGFPHVSQTSFPWVITF